MRSTTMAAALLLCGLVTSGAGANTLTFDLANNDYFPNYTEQGFLFTNNAESVYGSGNGPTALGTWGAGNPFSADASGTSATLFNNFLGTTTTLTAIGGGAFDLASIDFADVLNDGTIESFGMTFNYVGGGSTVGLFTLDNTLGLETFTFNYASLLSVTWNAPTAWLQWDNVNVTAAVATTPIPAALPLFVSALAGVGFLGYRRRMAKQATSFSERWC